MKWRAIDSTIAPHKYMLFHGGNVIRLSFSASEFKACDPGIGQCKSKRADKTLPNSR